MSQGDPPLVLVVDDEDDIRELIRVNVEAAGYRVATAADGDEAIAAVRERRPDAIFLDVLMPGVDGWTVLRTLKAAEPDLATVPVVMVTALTGTDDRLLGAIEGAVRYLTKPFRPGELVGTLTELLSPGAPPEEELRRAVRTDALERLARMEAGSEGTPRGPRVHLTRLEHTAAARVRRPPNPAPERVLTARQRELLAIVRDAGGVTAAATRLGTSRSNVYAGLRRIVERLGLRDTTELMRRLADDDLQDR